MILKKKYIGVFLVKQEGTFEIVGSKRFKIESESLNYKDGNYDLSNKTPTYRKGLKFFYCFELTNDQVLSLNERDNPIDPKIRKRIIKRHIINDLTSNLSGKALTINFIWLGLGAALGIFGTITVFYFL